MTTGSFFADLTSFLGRIEEEGTAMREAISSSASGDSNSLRNCLSGFDEQAFGRGEIDGQLTKRGASVIERALAKREDTRREMILEAADLEGGLTTTEEAVSELSSQRESTRACLDLLEFNEGALIDLEERLMAYGYNRKPMVLSSKQNNNNVSEDEGCSSTMHEDVQNRDGQQEPQPQRKPQSIIFDEQQCRMTSQEGGEGDGRVMENVVISSSSHVVIAQGECDEESETGEGEPQTPTLSEWAVSRHTRSILKTTWGNGRECNPSVPVRSLRSLALTERIATPMPNKYASSSHDHEFTTPADNNKPYSNQDNSDPSPADSDPPTPVAIDIGLKTTSLQKELKGNRLSTETNSTNSSSTPTSKMVHELSPMKTPRHRSMLENSIVSPNTSSNIENDEDVDMDEKNVFSLQASLNVSDSIDSFCTPAMHRNPLKGATSAANVPERPSCVTPSDPTTQGIPLPFPQNHHPVGTADLDAADTPEMPSPPKVPVMRVEDLENLASACPLMKVVDSVSEEEYASAPKFLTLQVTRDVLNSMVDKLNQYTAIHPSTDEWLLSADEMIQVMNDGETPDKTVEKHDEKHCKTVLLSLIHLKRLQMRGGGIIRYEILHSKFGPR